MDDATQVGRATAEAFSAGLGRGSAIALGTHAPGPNGLPANGGTAAQPTSLKGQVHAAAHERPSILCKFAMPGKCPTMLGRRIYHTTYDHTQGPRADGFARGRCQPE